MSTWYNFLLGRKNSSTSYVHYDDDGTHGSSAVVDEVVDENGFVMVKSEDRKQQRCTQVLSIPFFFIINTILHRHLNLIHVHQ